ncbi:MAG: hypothetical protein ACFFCW_31110 [Candidatus Hodarchaeota archaeon]
MKTESIVMLILALVMISFPVYGDNKGAIHYDGTDWLKFPKAGKFGFAAGLILSIGFLSDEINYQNNLIETELRKRKFPVEDFEHLIKFPVKDFELYETTAGQLVDGLDSFYSDRRNRNIKLINALYIVRAEIKGEDREYVKTWIRWLRIPESERRKGKGVVSLKLYRAKNGKLYHLRDYLRR